jgi:uncharacterized membrane protein
MVALPPATFEREISCAVAVYLPSGQAVGRPVCGTLLTGSACLADHRGGSSSIQRSMEFVGMDHRQIVASALATALALGLVTSAQAHKTDANKEKCYSVAKAGQNDCSDLNGLHTCAGEAATDNDPAEWRNVLKGTCKDLRGMSEAEAKRFIKG